MSNLRNQLEESHKDLHQWFLMHQECLLLQNDEYASNALEVFGVYLQQHIRFENTFVLPAMLSIRDNLRWNVSVYEKEHEKMEKMLVDVQLMLQGYYPLQGRVKRLALLEVLDREQSFYHLLEHHEQREEQDLFDHLQQLDSSVDEQWMRIDEELYQRFDATRQIIKVFLAQ